MKVASVNILRFENETSISKDDLVVVEEPLEIRLVHGPYHDRKEMRLAVTMRTPGEDEMLARGFLLTEGIVTENAAIISAKHCLQVRPEEAGNVIKVELHESIELDAAKLQRNFYTTSSCGVCGKTSLEAVNCVLPHKRQDFLHPKANILHSIPEIVRQHQRVFQHTGGLHAAAVLTQEGKLICLGEDIGRHNAVDKVIGFLMTQNQLPAENLILFVSGRAGFELVQKAAMAGFGAMLSVGAPSSLAVQLAKDNHLYLAGFARENRFNVYSYPQEL